MNPIILKNSALQLEFAPDTGVLTGFRVNETNWSILDRPQLGLSFKLLVPSGRRRNNPVDGEKQKLTQCVVAADGRSVRFVWDGVTSLHAGRLDIRVEMNVRLESDRAVWTMTLINRSDLEITAAYVPYFGDLRHAPDAEYLKLMTPGYTNPGEAKLWPTFRNQHGYFGFDHPMIAPGGNKGHTPMTPFYLLLDQKQGLFIGIDEPSWELAGWHAELLPGWDRSIDQRRPAGDHISQHEVFIRAGMIHIPYIQPGETRRLTPISIIPFQGDWHAGLDIYKRLPIMPPDAKAPHWIAEPHSWLQIHVNSPEGEARTRYADLVPLARQMAKHGIIGMQITGWNLGGQDQDNPCHDTDPLLGTWDEFLAAIREIKAMGVKVILFTKYTWADQGTDEFQNTYQRLAVTDPYGNYSVYPGYRYQTPMQMMDINTKRLIPMCFLSEEYLKVCEREFQKTLDLEADGFLFDECLHHGHTKLCFHPDHGHRRGAPVYSNDNTLIERFEAMSKPVNPDYCYAGEAIYDWEFAKYHLSYFRSETTDHQPWHRYVRPHAAIATAVTGFDDREMIAQCLLYRYIISYEPFNFKGSPEDYPLTLEYGKKMDALRTDLRRWFWDGECRDTLGATVTGPDGKPHSPYTLFRPMDGGAPGIAIANYSADTEAVLSLAIEGQDVNTYKYRLIDDPTWKPAGKGVRIPARGAVVVIPRDKMNSPSLLLNQPIARVEPFGDPEPSFIGGGRVGAGGRPDGNWEFLIGPTYSSPTFLTEERLSLGWHGGRNRPLAPTMHRVAGSGLLVGRQRVDDLEIELWECAPWDGLEALRIVAVTNRGATAVPSLRLTAFVRAPGNPQVKDGQLHVALPTGTKSYGGECPSWADRTARLAWNRPQTIETDKRYDVGTGFLLVCPLGDLLPGATAVAALAHRLDEGDLPVWQPAEDPAAVIHRELAGWRTWLSQAVPAVRQDPLLESQAVFIRMQQSYDGGFIAGVRRYAYSYIRDMHGACRGLLAVGFRDEVARALTWIERKVARFGTVINASEMGADVRDFVGGHKGTELPAYYILMACRYLEQGGSPSTIDACRAGLTLAANEQIAVSRTEGWRFHYNGDETERYVPLVDGANYRFGKPDWDPKRMQWSMPSHVLAMASVTVFARDLAPRWGMDPAPYLAAVEAWRTSFDPTFRPDGRALPAWTVFPDGTLPAYPVPNYLLFAAWTDAPFPAPDVRAWVEAAEGHLDPVRGRVPVCPGAVEGSCGHDLALLLYGLKHIGAEPERIARVETCIRNGGQLQWFGMVNEFYGPDGTPNQHNLRPFETGPLLEALIKSVERDGCRVTGVA